jgi:hypothetical protein
MATLEETSGLNVPDEQIDILPPNAVPDAADEEAQSAATAGVNTPDEHTEMIHPPPNTAVELGAGKKAGTRSRKVRQGSRCGSCIGACQLRITRICATKVCGFTLPVFLGLFGGLILPTMDAGSDWAVLISWYYSGDYGWFKASLIIQLISGTLNGLMLALPMQDYYHKPWYVCVPIGLLLGMPGLAPVAYTAMVLSKEDFDDSSDDVQLVKLFKGLELVFEAMPQSVLQVYVGVAYGKLDPSSDLDYLLAVSVFISLLGAGATAAGFESLDRESMTVTSRAGFFLALLRSSQTAALVFWIALMGCAAKGLAAIALAVGVMVYFWMGIEGVSRENALDEAGCRNCFDCLRCRGGSKVEKCGHSTVGLCGLHKGESVRGGFLWGCIYFIFIFGVALVFFTADHVDNNYLNDTMPMAGPGAPQHYDCHDRTSGIYPAALATVMSLVFLFPAMLTDPKYGLKCCRGPDWDERNARMEAKVRRKAAKQGRNEAEAVFHEKVKAIWRWANATGGDFLDPFELARMSTRVHTGSEQDEDEAQGHGYDGLCRRFDVTPQEVDERGKFVLEDEFDELDIAAENGFLVWEVYESYMIDNREYVEAAYSSGEFRLTPKNIIVSLLCGC